MYIRNPGHMTKMAAMPMYGKKNLGMKLGMNHRGLKYYNVFINYDLWMTLTYFTARST